MESETTPIAGFWGDLAELIELWEPFMKRLHLIAYGLAVLVGVRHGLAIAVGFAALNLAGRMWWLFCRRLARTQAARLATKEST